MNNNKYPNLTSPIQLGKVTFRNRIFSAPMGATDITADCCPGPRTQGFYELRAKGGAAAAWFTLKPTAATCFISTLRRLAASLPIPSLPMPSVGMGLCQASNFRTLASMPERICLTRTRRQA